MPNNDYIPRGDALKAVCENCSMQGDGGKPCSSRCEDYALVLKIPAADVEPRQRWIPVTDADNLPKKSTPCLVVCNQWGGEIVRKATYLDSEKSFFEGEFDITEYVTHWMPSPELPKGEDNAEKQTT